MTDGLFKNERRPCSQGKTFDFNVAIGTYMYNVNITNIAGSSILTEPGKLCSEAVSVVVLNIADFKYLVLI